MFKKLAVVLITFALVIGTTPVQAGGWVVVTLDELPSQAVANQPVTIGFTIRAHGRTPINVEETAAVFYHDGSDARYRFDAKPQGATGHYVAEVKLPQAGKWRWHIQTWMEHVMPDVIVVTAEPASAQPVTLAETLAKLPLIGGLFSQAKQRAELTRQTALGQNLFLAKGCATCHTHAAVSDKAGFSTNVGPNLTERPLDPNYLRVWLKDPSAVKSGTEMPNLELKKTEIEALRAFLAQ